MAAELPARPKVVSDGGLVPVRVAEQLLGLSHKSVLRRIKLGLLQGCPDPDSGDYKVSRASIEEALRRRRVAQELASASPPGSAPIEDR